MSNSKSALESLFDCLYHKQLHNVEGILPRARSDYRKRLQELTTEQKRKINYIKSLLDYCEQARWPHANSQLEPAEEEYHRYFVTNLPKSGYYQLHGPQADNTPPSLMPLNTNVGSASVGNRKGVHWTDAEQTAQQTTTRKSTPSKPPSRDKAVHNTQDANAIVNIKQRFESLYQTEWAESLKELIQLKIYERLAAQCLLRILLDAYRVCKIEAENQIAKLEDAAYHIMIEGLHDNGEVVRGNRACLVEYRKGISDICVDKLQETFSRRYLPEIIRSIGVYQNIRSHGPVHIYTNQCVALCWSMVVQDPPLYICDDRNSQAAFNSDLYNCYTNAGPSVDFYVWPPLFSWKDGELLCKGFAQGR